MRDGDELLADDPLALYDRSPFEVMSHELLVTMSCHLGTLVSGWPDGVNVNGGVKVSLSFGIYTGFASANI